MQNLSVTPCDQTHKILSFQNSLHSLAFLESLTSSPSVPLPAPLRLLLTSDPLEHTLLASCFCSCFLFSHSFSYDVPYLCYTAQPRSPFSGAWLWFSIAFSWLLFWVKGPSMWPYSLLGIPGFSNLWFGIEMMCVSCSAGRLFFQGKERSLGHSSFISVWTRHIPCCDKRFFFDVASHVRKACRGQDKGWLWMRQEDHENP